MSDYEKWYDEAMYESNAAGYAGFTAAQTIAHQAAHITELEALSANLKQEAQIHAMEARGANATINEINQFISGATGESANWHGAQPVKDFVNGLKAQLAEAKKDAELLDYLNGKRYWLHSGDGYYESTVKFKWGDSVKRRNLRQAIDAAIAEESNVRP